MDNELVHPNLHVAILHFPLALLIAGTLIELFSFMWRRHGFRAAGRWMILVGALMALPTALSGFQALADVANPTHAVAEWKQTSTLGALTDQQWDMLGDHLTLMSSATILAVLVVVVWLACSDRWRGRLQLPFLAILLVVSGLLVAGAWHGGEAVYAQHVAVGKETTGANKDAASTSPAKSAASTAESNGGEPRFVAQIGYVSPPMQTHVILAGITVALALASLGLSIRKITQGPPITQLDYIAAALGPPSTLIGPDGSDTLVVGDNPAVPEPQDVAVPRVPASRFWLVAPLAGILTAAAGYWTIASQSHVWSINDLWLAKIREHARLFAHLISGSSIIVLCLILSILARWAPRRKWLLVLFATLAVLAIAAQIWFGILLMFDTAKGPVFRFN